jgi:hypothetical protein
MYLSVSKRLRQFTQLTSYYLEKAYDETDDIGKSVLELSDRVIIYYLRIL